MCDNKKDQSLGFRNEAMVSIKVEALNRLIMRDRQLSKLEAAGVDNWEGYDEAMRLTIDEDELTE